ncbi:MAG: hypothetical protein KF689_02840 [Gemmatimonadaceae bacterium]|nr:hypothetical protein [Gemmatimonadaceae bacterium]MCW5827668.1 hypothetical protein [Gemmatimonadaceae bacterium]
MTPPDSAIHIFEATRSAHFGREGDGPGEVRAPSDVILDHETVAVLDYGAGRLTTYDFAGRVIRTRMVPALTSRRIFVTGADTLLEYRVPFSSTRALVRIAGTRTDTVYAWESAPRALRLEASGAPIMVIPAPYVAEPQWAVAASGVIAVWTPETNQVELRTLSGRSVGSFAGPTAPHQVSGADREAWLESAVPDGAVFAPLRARARVLATFPRTLPPVLSMLGDPRGGVWLQRTTSAEGETWEHRSATGALLGSVRLPEGRRLRAIGPSRIAALAETPDGDQVVEIYSRTQ